MQRPITRGAAANAGLIFHVFVQDSTSLVGAGKASIGFASFTCYYIRNGEAISGAITPQDITTIGTYVAPTANTNVRIKAVDNTNMIGIYEVQIHADWVNTTNSCQSLTIFLSASGAAVLPIQIPLIAVNEQDAAAAANLIADHVLRRTYANARTSSNGDAVAFRSLLGAIGKLVNKWSITGATLTIFQEDDATSTAPGGTQAITTTAGADPITALDP